MSLGAERILDMIRPLVIVVDGAGVVSEIRGGFGGFLGYDLDQLVGVSVFDYVVPDEVDELATYFAESAGESLDTVSLPLPFRVNLIGADGVEQPVDVIPTGRDDGTDRWGWVVLIVPVSLYPSVFRPLDAEMAGEPRERVREMLTEELAVDNQHYSSRCFLVDLAELPMPTVTTSRAPDRDMAAAIAEEVSSCGWRPWEAVSPGDTAPLALDDLPDPLHAFADERSWRRVSVTPVHLDGAPVGAYVLFGRVPADYVVTEVNANVLARIRRLVDVTALLIARWRERDRLLAAATRDSLTGLANRDAFSDALSRVGERAALLYIDVDHFKAVNDRHGHEVGDRVLVEVGRRIVEGCRPVDVVARFGGDEFVVLLDDVDAARAQAIGERIVALVGAPMKEFGGLERVTVSVGLARLDVDDDAVNSADRAMLQAKRDGRGRLVRAVTEASTSPAGEPDGPGVWSGERR